MADDDVPELEGYSTMANDECQPSWSGTAQESLLLGPPPKSGPVSITRMEVQRMVRIENDLSNVPTLEASRRQLGIPEGGTSVGTEATVGQDPHDPEPYRRRWKAGLLRGFVKEGSGAGASASGDSSRGTGSSHPMFDDPSLTKTKVASSGSKTTTHNEIPPPTTLQPRMDDNAACIMREVEEDNREKASGSSSYESLDSESEPADDTPNLASEVFNTELKPVMHLILDLHEMVTKLEPLSGKVYASMPVQVHRRIMSAGLGILVAIEESFATLTMDADKEAYGGNKMAFYNLRKLLLLVAAYAPLRNAVTTAANNTFFHNSATKIKEKMVALAEMNKAAQGTILFNATHYRAGEYCQEDKDAAFAKIWESLKGLFLSSDMGVDKKLHDARLSTAAKCESAAQEAKIQCGHKLEKNQLGALDDLISVMPLAGKVSEEALESDQAARASLGQGNYWEQTTLAARNRSTDKLLGTHHWGMPDRERIAMNLFSITNNGNLDVDTLNGRTWEYYAQFEEETSDCWKNRREDIVLRPTMLFTGGIALVEGFQKFGPWKWQDVESTFMDRGGKLHTSIFKDMPAIMDDLYEAGFNIHSAMLDGTIGENFCINKKNLNLRLPDRASLLFLGRIDDGSSISELHLENRRAAYRYYRVVHLFGCKYWTLEDLVLKQDERWDEIPPDRSAAIQLFMCLGQVQKREGRRIEHKRVASSPDCSSTTYDGLEGGVQPVKAWQRHKSSADHGARRGGKAEGLQPVKTCPGTILLEKAMALSQDRHSPATSQAKVPQPGTHHSWQGHQVHCDKNATYERNSKASG